MTCFCAFIKIMTCTCTHNNIIMCISSHLYKTLYVWFTKTFLRIYHCKFLPSIYICTWQLILITTCTISVNKYDCKHVQWISSSLAWSQSCANMYSVAIILSFSCLFTALLVSVYRFECPHYQHGQWRGRCRRASTRLWGLRSLRRLLGLKSKTKIIVK